MSAAGTLRVGARPARTGAMAAPIAVLGAWKTVGAFMAFLLFGETLGVAVAGMAVATAGLALVNRG